MAIAPQAFSKCLIASLLHAVLYFHRSLNQLSTLHRHHIHSKLDLRNKNDLVASSNPAQRDQQVYKGA